jgi:hypothetical protein
MISNELKVHILSPNIPRAEKVRHDCNAAADMLAVAILSLNLLFSINKSYADTSIR